MSCAGCKYNDGRVYSSVPPQYRCTITGKFYYPLDECGVEFAPVKHGRWIEHGTNKDKTHSIWCSACNASIKSKGHAKSIYTKKHFPFCQYCGAKMDEEVE